MKDFDKAYLKFLNKYKDEPWFEGAILCGSYATGNNDENSDIDIFIISNDSEDWRERGNIIVNGFMIEYFINPVRQVKNEITEELNSLSRHTSNMFNQGKIIEDKNGKVCELKELAKKTLLTKTQSNEYRYLINCYLVWERFDEVESKYLKGEDLDLSYYYFLQGAIDCISYNKQLGSYSINKLEKFLYNAEFRKNYGIKQFFNNKEQNILKKCLTEKEQQQKYSNARTLYEYICKEFNFDITKFSYRSKI